MLNPDFILASALVFIAIIIYFYKHLFVDLYYFFFPKREDDESQLFCPKCGSTNWRMANPLKPSESMINLPEMVSVVTECRDCGYIGMFLEKFKGDKVKIRPPKKRMDIPVKHRVPLFILVLIILLFSPSLYWSIILVGFVMLLYRRHSN